jgi:hypothetical protein
MDIKIISYNKGLISIEYSKTNCATILKYYNRNDDLILKKTYIDYWTKDALTLFKTDIRNLTAYLKLYSHGNNNNAQRNI